MLALTQTTDTPSEFSVAIAFKEGVRPFEYFQFAHRAWPARRDPIPTIRTVHEGD